MKSWSTCSHQVSFSPHGLRYKARNDSLSLKQLQDMHMLTFWQSSFSQYLQSERGEEGREGGRERGREGGREEGEREEGRKGGREGGRREGGREG